MKRMEKFMKNGKSLILAYDQGLEHGPVDFNDKNVDPAYVYAIAKANGFSAFAVQKGIAENYYDRGVPLILKLNGKTSIYGKEPIARANCSVRHAHKLGAAAVGYTIYIGSEHESEMFAEFGRVQEEAHDLGLAAILWVYPRGEYVKSDTSRDMLAYATRSALELGADAVKVKYGGNMEDFKWAVKAAARMPVYMAGGPKANDEVEFLRHAWECIQAGGIGIAVGRNVWQSDNPARTSKRLAAIVFDGKSVDDAMKIS